MTAYAIAHLRQPGTVDAEVYEYMELIQATLDPFQGRFLVHGGQTRVLEGSWPGATVVIEFPDFTAAEEWYASADYPKILPLRTNHLVGDVILADGCGPDHDSAAMGARLREAAR
ncbi:DUF1330 domain-containing protein [Amycolatopsis sp. AA4]|uniref:DUF1330 domain-containing protein n=1 Tax=Actinomycetes TaxID=1760 RepID=UPI0001B5553B|nr:MULTISPECIES: DUF1330 domain-containing protein [Actinomycetes]ATY10634.1 DUF1330 domain-containing protein [Amycolatopsis sp. AA4]EFL06140.1 conserved hypothetical protein [Streptomyces sp. AA4]